MHWMLHKEICYFSWTVLRIFFFASRCCRAQSMRSMLGKIITIYVPMIYTAPCVMLLMRAASITWASGRGLGPGNREFSGPCEMASSRKASAISGLKINKKTRWISLFRSGKRPLWRTSCDGTAASRHVTATCSSPGTFSSVLCRQSVWE